MHALNAGKSKWPCRPGGCNIGLPVRLSWSRPTALTRARRGRGRPQCPPCRSHGDSGSRVPVYTHGDEQSPISRSSANRDPASRSRPNILDFPIFNLIADNTKAHSGNGGGFPASSLSSRIRPNRETGDPLLVSRPNRESESRGMGMGHFGFWSGHPGPASAASCPAPARAASCSRLGDTSGIQPQFRT
jgi:hypothetical protein